MARPSSRTVVGLAIAMIDSIMSFIGTYILAEE